MCPGCRTQVPLVVIHAGEPGLIHEADAPRRKSAAPSPDAWPVKSPRPRPRLERDVEAAMLPGPQRNLVIAAHQRQVIADEERVVIGNAPGGAAAAIWNPPVTTTIIVPG